MAQLSPSTTTKPEPVSHTTYHPKQPTAIPSHSNTPQPNPNPTSLARAAGHGHPYSQASQKHQDFLRFTSPPWTNYMDINPLQPITIPTAHILSSRDTTPQPLPLPPSPAHPKWRGRCYNCLQIGHDQNGCPSKERVCAKCWERGHEAKNCKRTPQIPSSESNPLVPRGHLGEDKLPANRPAVAVVFIPETQQMKHDTHELSRAIVIDARLRPNHSMHVVQSVLMSVCNSDLPFPLTHIGGPQYLLILQHDSKRDHFLSTFSKPLECLGYVAFPWSPRVNGYPMALRFRVWLELQNMSPQAWSLDHLVAAVSSFGIVLEHSSMYKPKSIENMQVVAAVPELRLIPQRVQMWIRGISRDVEVRVKSWIEDPLPLTHATDLTPSAEVFDQIKQRNNLSCGGPSGNTDTLGNITIDVLTLFGVWEAMQEGPDRDKVADLLRSSNQIDPTLLGQAEGPQQVGRQLIEGVNEPPPVHADSKGKGIVVQLEVSNFQTTGEKLNQLHATVHCTEHATIHRTDATPVRTTEGTGIGRSFQINSNPMAQVPPNELERIRGARFGLNPTPLALPTLILQRPENPTSGQTPPTGPLGQTRGSTYKPSGQLDQTIGPLGQTLFPPSPPNGPSARPLYQPGQSPPQLGHQVNNNMACASSHRVLQSPTGPGLFHQLDRVLPSPTGPGLIQNPIIISSSSNSLLEPAICIPPDGPTTATAPIPQTGINHGSQAGMDLDNILNEPQPEPMEEVPSETRATGENSSPVCNTEVQAMWAAAEASYDNYNGDGQEASLNEQIGSNSGVPNAGVISYISSESSTCEAERLMRMCREELEQQDLIREQKEAYQSALADPLQAHLFNSDELHPHPHTHSNAKNAENSGKQSLPPLTTGQPPNPIANPNPEPEPLPPSPHVPAANRILHHTTANTTPTRTEPISSQPEMAQAGPEQMAIDEQSPVRLTPAALSAQSPTNQQPQLRRSVRILELGDKATKHYTPKKSRAKRTPKAKPSQRSVDPARKAEIIMALQQEHLAHDPLDSSMVQDLNTICGIRTD
ncbi:hypothetical protein FCM35_KLT19404 [Carex littledalei]|uniref:CCHC-type domain-containing protein n=1 Tax=Carex littledalei TaxID=544730 RepID=A0A833RJJ5_9POAL|nr:hypothetical protein FCM35_KLT19404 [Carex littledalei]